MKKKNSVREVIKEVLEGLIPAICAVDGGDCSSCQEDFIEEANKSIIKDWSFEYIMGNDEWDGSNIDNPFSIYLKG